MKLAPSWRIALSALCLTVTLPIATAYAQARAKVVLLTAERNSSTVHRLEAELRALEIDVIVVVTDGEGQSIRKELRRVAKERGAFAAVRIVPSADEAEVWVMDRVTGKTLVREIVSGKDAGSFDDAISLGAVELLRASLLEVSASMELKGDVPTPVEVKALIKEPKPNALDAAKTQARAPAAYLQLAIEPAVDFGVKQLTTGTSIELDLKLTNRRGYGAELLGRSPFSAQKAYQPEGTAEIRAQQFGVLGCYVAPGRTLRPSLSLGFLAANITADGQAEAPLRTQKQSRFRVFPAARLGLSWALLPAVALRTDLSFAYSVTPLAIRIAGKEAADFGQPTVALAIGLELRLPLDGAK